MPATFDRLYRLEWHALRHAIERMPSAELRELLGRSDALDRTLRAELARRGRRDVLYPGLPLLG